MSKIINELKALEVKYGITYKDVLLGDLFEINTSPSIDKGTLVNAHKGPYEFIGRTKQNYGVQQYIQKQNWEPNPENTFSISQIGSIHMQWRANKWYSSQNMFLLIPKVLDFSKSFNYITACVNKQFIGSGYQNYPTLKSLHILSISLPHEPDGTLAIGFMEEFIATLERERLATLERERLATLDAYLSVKGWTIDDLGEKSEIQNQLTNLLETREIEWKEVQLDDLFEIRSSKRIFHSNQVHIGNEGHNYVVRSTINNGIRGKIQESNLDLNPGNTLSFAQDTFSVFYQKEPYFTGNKVKILVSKNDLNEKVLRYIATSLQKVIMSSTWGESSTIQTISKTKFVLPHTPDGNLDLEFMEKFIELIEKLKIHNVANELQTRINLTESIISNNN